MRKFDCIERPLSKQFYRYGVYITKHPAPFVVFPVLFVLIMSDLLVHSDKCSVKNGTSSNSWSMAFSQWNLYAGTFGYTVKRNSGLKAYYSLIFNFFLDHCPGKRRKEHIGATVFKLCCCFGQFHSEQSESSVWRQNVHLSQSLSCRP
jgi:hypothetical protein